MACRRSRVRVSLAPVDVSRAERRSLRTYPLRVVRPRNTSISGSLPDHRAAERSEVPTRRGSARASPDRSRRAGIPWSSMPGLKPPPPTRPRGRTWAANPVGRKPNRTQMSAAECRLSNEGSGRGRGGSGRAAPKIRMSPLVPPRWYHYPRPGRRAHSGLREARQRRRSLGGRCQGIRASCRNRA